MAAWQKHLEQAGAEFRPMQQRPDGAWQIFLRDPDGHFVELFAFWSRRPDHVCTGHPGAKNVVQFIRSGNGESA